jgi:hypothetical protein
MRGVARAQAKKLIPIAHQPATPPCWRCCTAAACGELM